MSSQQQPQKQELIPRNPQYDTATEEGRVGALITTMAEVIGKKPITNFRGERKETYQFMQKCLGPNCREGKMHLGEVIDMVYYFVTAIDQLHEESGDMRPAVYVVLVDGTGQATGYWSAFVARDLGRMIQAMGEPAPDAPLPVRVVQAVRPGKQQWYTLELV